MTAFLRALVAAWRFLMDFIAGSFDWLRRPGNKLKVVCAVLAFFCLTAGLAAFEREQQVLRLAGQIVVIETQCTVDKAMLQRDIEDRDARIALVADTLRKNADELKAIKAEAAAELGRLAEEIEAIEVAATSWRARYDGRPEECEAALELLDAACPTLKGY